MDDIFPPSERDRLQRVLAVWKPRSAWLFGSRAKNVAGSESDVDLLIIDERAGGEQGIEIDISCDLMPRRYHLDILAYKPEYFAGELAQAESFTNSILKSAELLYERS